MEPISVDNDVRSITFLKARTDGDYDVTHLTPEGKRKRQSRTVRPLERAMRKLAQAQANAAMVYLARHERSNRRKRNGWLWDLGTNMTKASRAARKSPRVVVLRED